MAKLYFYYSAMNAGKSTHLLQAAYNYEERHQTVFLLTPSLDDRHGIGKVTSRIGLQREAQIFQATDNLQEICEQKRRDNKGALDCVLVDEAQFLKKEQVQQLADFIDQANVPVMCYGLRTDAFGELFEGSAALLAWSDELKELKTICHCGRKATMVLRIDEAGNPVTHGQQIAIGGNDSYVSMCRRHWREAFLTPAKKISEAV